MNATSQSLLLRAQRGEPDAWRALADLYRPLIAGWLRYQAIPPHDVDDLVQEILVSVVQNLAAFSHSGRRGAFRAWLRTITFHEMADYWKRCRHRASPAADLAAEEAIARLVDPQASLARVWDAEHDRFVLKSMIDSLEAAFEPDTVRIFRRVALDGRPVAEVAGEMSMSVGAVYAAKSRVLQKLRLVARELIDGIE